MNFLYLKGSSTRDVRLTKFIDSLVRMGHLVSFWGWSRIENEPIDERLLECRYLYRGGAYGRKSAFHYPLWMVRLFVSLLFARGLNDVKIIAVNFDAALPTYVASLVRRFGYVYEIYDEFAMSYGFPRWLKWILTKIDHAIIRRSKFVIHVDSNRITYRQSKSIVIENAPNDYWQGAARDYTCMRKVFAVTGCLSKIRGIRSICEFAAAHPEVEIVVVGTFFDGETQKKVENTRNIAYYEFMPQQELFQLLEGCCGIFSLYDPTIEINRLAASNKVYDAMMLGIPVITNKEVLNSKFIRDKGIGVVLDYDYNETWDALADDLFISEAVGMGKRGRALYLQSYQFDKMVRERFLPEIETRMEGER